MRCRRSFWICWREGGVFGGVIVLGWIPLHGRVGALPLNGATEGLGTRGRLGIAEFLADAGGIGGPVLAEVPALLEVRGNAIVRQDHEFAVPSGRFGDPVAPVEFGEIFGIADVVGPAGGTRIGGGE